MATGAPTDDLFHTTRDGTIWAESGEATSAASVSERTRLVASTCYATTSTRLTTGVTMSGASSTGTSRRA